METQTQKNTNFLFNQTELSIDNKQKINIITKFLKLFTDFSLFKNNNKYFLDCSINVNLFKKDIIKKDFLFKNTLFISIYKNFAL
jgi:hypothetical protein